VTPGSTAGVDHDGEQLIHIRPLKHTEMVSEIPIRIGGYQKNTFCDIAMGKVFYKQGCFSVSHLNDHLKN